MAGSEWLSLSEIWQGLWYFNPQDNSHLLLRYMRLPRTGLTLLVGAALGTSGAMMQALARNPLADPGLLGINAGAATAIVIGLALFGLNLPIFYLWFGLLGAALAGAAVVLLGGALRSISPVRLILAGAALSMLLMAITQTFTVNSPDHIFDQFRHWSSGSLQGRGADVLLPVAIVACLGLLLSFALAPALDVMVLGEEIGRALGSRLPLIWGFCALSIILLTGSATAAAGPISFVGLTSAHLSRMLVGSSHRRLLPCAALVGAMIVLCADVLGRIIAPPGEVSAGIVAALLGSPFFIAMVRRHKGALS